jgi:hypothetical protein
MKLDTLCLGKRKNFRKEVAVWALKAPCPSFEENPPSQPQC